MKGTEINATVSWLPINFYENVIEIWVFSVGLVYEKSKVIIIKQGVYTTGDVSLQLCFYPWAYLSLDGRVSWESQSLRARSFPWVFESFNRKTSEQWFSSMGDFAPGGTFGDFWIHFQLGYWYLVGQVRGAATHPTLYRTAPNNKEASAL